MTSEGKKKAAHILAGCAVVALLLAGCGSTAPQERHEPHALLVEGKYTQARAAAMLAGADTPEMRGIIALSLIVEEPSEVRAHEAIEALSRGATRIAAAAAASIMLELAYEIPQPVPAMTSSQIVFTALGAVGHGPYAEQPGLQVPLGAASRDVATAALDRIKVALSSPEMSSIDTNHLLIIWNACFTLLGGNMEAPSDVQAWQLFHSIGSIAVAMYKAAPAGDLSKVLLSSAVHAVESNPQIAIAARCDIASPYDGLKAALSRDLELRKRLELAVAGAAGCSRGTYAPKTH